MTKFYIIKEANNGWYGSRVCQRLALLISSITREYMDIKFDVFSTYAEDVDDARVRLEKEGVKARKRSNQTYLELILFSLMEQEKELISLKQPLLDQQKKREEILAEYVDKMAKKIKAIDDSISWPFAPGKTVIAKNIG